MRAVPVLSRTSNGGPSPSRQRSANPMRSAYTLPTAGRQGISGIPGPHRAATVRWRRRGWPRSYRACPPCRPARRCPFLPQRSVGRWGPRPERRRRAPRRRCQLDREGYVSAVDFEVLHEAQLDDALAEVGIHDRSQGIEHHCLGGRRAAALLRERSALGLGPEAHTPKLSPQPQVVLALGFSIWKPLSLRPSA